jgi:CheY-like chemotaxis protein
MPHKILVVEDDFDLQMLMTKKLTMEGFEVIQATTGQDALNLLKQKPDLILLDILLPDIDGLTVLSEIVQDEQAKKIPVIILSNLADSSAVEQAAAIGKYEYLVKAKTDLNTVVNKIREYLR